MATKKDNEARARAELGPIESGRLAAARAAVDDAQREADARTDEPEREDAPFSLAFHPDGTAKRMVISRPDGSSEREVTVAEWESLQRGAQPGAWIIKFTEVVAQHHSDGIF